MKIVFSGQLPLNIIFINWPFLYLNVFKMQISNNVYRDNVRDE